MWLHLEGEGEVAERYKKIFFYVLELVKYDADYEVRDRGRVVEAAIDRESPAFASLKAAMMAPKPLPQLNDPFLEKAKYQLGSLSHLFGNALLGYEALPTWPETQPDPTVRDPPIKNELSDESDFSSSYSDYTDSDSDGEEESSDESSDEDDDSDQSDSSSDESSSDDDESDESDSSSEDERPAIKKKVVPVKTVVKPAAKVIVKKATPAPAAPIIRKAASPKAPSPKEASPASSTHASRGASPLVDDTSSPLPEGVITEGDEQPKLNPDEKPFDINEEVGEEPANADALFGDDNEDEAEDDE